MKELTRQQMEQQDKVDNAIHGLVEHLTGHAEEWDIEKISQIRLLIMELYGLDESFYASVDE